MTIGMTETGLAEINESEGVYTDSVKRGYSDCTMRITYAATLTAGAQLGDSDNPNEVVLTWKRTNTGYFDTLQDCCHVYTYGVDVMKQFSDGKGDLANVHFLLHNDTDDVYVIAEQRDGMYYVKGFTGKKADATTFVPNDSGHIIVNGLEDDTYISRVWASALVCWLRLAVSASLQGGNAVGKKAALLAVALAVAGLCILLWPVVSGHRLQADMSAAAQGFLEEARQSYASAAAGRGYDHAVN